MFFLIFLFSCFFYLPILQNHNLLIERGNDLQEFFFPIFYFVRESIIKYHQLPFWNNLFFSGTPLLPDPQAPIFYLPNIIFLFLNSIDTGFIVSVFIHVMVGGLGMYLLAKNGFKFPTKISLFCSFLYIASPKLSGYIEAGHFGLITSWAFLPFVFLCTFNLSKKPKIRNSILLAITLALIFYSHILIFAITTFSTTCLLVYLTIQKQEKKIRSLIFFAFSGIFSFGLVAIALLPQLSWQNQTTRNLLLNGPDVYPKWISKIEFIKASVSPIIFGPNFIQSIDTEKIIGIGLFVCFLALIGFLRLNKKNKLVLFTSILIIILISLNNSSPLYDLLIKSNFFILLRVATRFWFLLVILSILLAGFGLEFIAKNKNLKFLAYILGFLAVGELLLTSWTRMITPIQIDLNLAPNEIYSFLAQDKTQFRVLCLERCLSQKESVIYGLELADGYGTLQQKNYYLESEQLTQSFYNNRYTLSIPPFEIFEYEKLQPYSPNLASFNIKYVISDHPLTDKNLKPVRNFGKYQVYLNEINLPRSNYPIKVYTPNFIQIDTSNYKDNSVVLSEIFNSDWEVQTNQNKKVKIIETPDKTREVQINKDTKFANFIYQPKSFLIGFIITSVTIVLILAIYEII